MIFSLIILLILHFIDYLCTQITYFVIIFARRMRDIRRLCLFVIMLVGAWCALPAIDLSALGDGLEYSISAEISTADGDYTPLWLSSNKYGLSSLETTNGYLRAGIERPLNVDESRRWGIGYGIDLVGAANYTSSFIVQQAYFEVRWLNGVLTVGSKEQPMELKNQWLSSGSQTLGINARPIPQVRLALHDYWAIPGTKNWLAIKGHIAYGMMTDSNWQKDFTKKESKYAENVLYHSKAGYIMIGRPDRPLTVELGLEMACEFGGTSYYVTDSEGNYIGIDNGSGLKAFWNALIPGGSDTGDGDYKNVEGNHVGSWMARVNLNYDTWYLGIYGEHFFEDHSAMFHISNNGYGSGDEWNERVDNTYNLYSLKDMMLGVELWLKGDNLPINNFVIEYLYTKYQSGPIYHDHTSSFSDQIGGRDDYYNHFMFGGWQHWGMVMGNPLYLSPLYNDDGTIMVKNNRFVAWHFGLSGEPADWFDYRLLLTYEKGFGRYAEPYTNPREDVSLLAEVNYFFPEDGWLKGWSVRGAFGMDRGKLLGDNTGFQLTITKKGLFR